MIFEHAEEAVKSPGNGLAAQNEAMQEADTLLLTIPNTLGVEYNVHVLSAILEYFATALG